MAQSQYIGEHAISRPRVTARLVIEIIVWVLAFSLLLCVPADRSKGGGSSAERARATEKR